MDKVEHVRAAIRKGNTGNHHCHWPGCGKMVPPAAWGCKKHWFMLPWAIRNRIWRAYRPTQEETKTPSREYVAAAKEAQDWINKHYQPVTEADVIQAEMSFTKP